MRLRLMLALFLTMLYPLVSSYELVNYTGDGTFDVRVGDGLKIYNSYYLLVKEINPNSAHFELYRPYGSLFYGTTIAVGKNISFPPASIKLLSVEYIPSNQSFVRATISSYKVDVALSVIRKPERTFGWGRVISVSDLVSNVSVENKGELEIGNVNIAYRFMKNNNVAWVFRDTVRNLKAGASVDLTLDARDWVSPTKPASQADSFSLEIGVDPEDYIAESDETNNAVEIPFKVSSETTSTQATTTTVSPSTTTLIATTTSEELTTSTSETPTAPPPDRKKQFDWTTPGLLAVVLVIALSLFYYFFARKSSRK